LFVSSILYTYFFFGGSGNSIPFGRNLFKDAGISGISIFLLLLELDGGKGSIFCSLFLEKLVSSIVLLSCYFFDYKN